MASLVKRLWSCLWRLTSITAVNAYVIKLVAFIFFGFNFFDFLGQNRVKGSLIIHVNPDIVIVCSSLNSKQVRRGGSSRFIQQDLFEAWFHCTNSLLSSNGFWNRNDTTFVSILYKLAQIILAAIEWKSWVRKLWKINSSNIVTVNHQIACMDIAHLTWCTKDSNLLVFVISDRRYGFQRSCSVLNGERLTCGIGCSPITHSGLGIFLIK